MLGPAGGGVRGTRQARSGRGGHGLAADEHDGGDRDGGRGRRRELSVSEETPEAGGLRPEVLAHYEVANEACRLNTDGGRLELARSQEIIERFIPPPPAVVLDVGGGPGAYATWLAGRGYEVHLIDPVPLHVEQARRASERETGRPLASARIGDARRLDRAAESADGVLMLGPLYHLTEREDRVAALREALRVLRPGGVLVAAGISRFASTLDGLARRYLEDPTFERIAERDLRDGQHRNPTGQISYFTTAFFHHPGEMQEEAEQAGFRHEATLAVEGPAWLLHDLADRWGRPGSRDALLAALRRLEAEPSLLGASA